MLNSWNSQRSTYSIYQQQLNRVRISPLKDATDVNFTVQMSVKEIPGTIGMIQRALQNYKTLVLLKNPRYEKMKELCVDLELLVEIVILKKRGAKD